MKSPLCLAVLVVLLSGGSWSATLRAQAPVPAQAALPSNRAELDKQYIEGKITAKQYQKMLDRFLLEESKRASLPAPPVVAPPAQKSPVTAAKPSPSAAAPAGSKTNSGGPAKAGPAPSAVPSAKGAPGSTNPQLSPAQQQKISDVEAKIDEMLRLRAAREKAAAVTNAAAAAATTNAGPAKPLTKRQKLDGLLRQFVNGEVTEADYNAKRGRIMAEPD